MASSSSAKYTVFISHAGTDKETIAIPLRAKLMLNNITAFVDEEDMHPGTVAKKAMTDAIETAEIAVVVISPEFIARKWPMRELMCFLRRREETLEESRCLPVIIPFFYRLSVSDLYGEPRLDRVDEYGQSIYLKSRFLERMNNGEREAQVGEIRAALRKVHEIMGVRNNNGATNECTDGMEVKREHLLDTLCEKIRNAVLQVPGETKTHVQTAEEENSASNHSGKEIQLRRGKLVGKKVWGAVLKVTGKKRAKERTGEENTEQFRRPMDSPCDMTNLVFNFSSQDENGYANTKEGQVLEKLADNRPGVNRAIAIRGIGGVGKTSLLRALCALRSVKKRFRDGVYRISMGMDCTRRKLIEELSDAVEKSGGLRTARKMSQESEFGKVSGLFRSWFGGRQCLFAVDDVWETGEITSAIINKIVQLHQSGKGSKVLLTTRSAEVASRAEIYMEVEPREILGCESRAILFRNSGITPPEDDNEASNVVNEILERCGGLPVFLAAAGKSVNDLNFRSGLQGFAAYRMYAENLEANIQTLLDTDVGEYKRLSRRLLTAIEVVERRKNALGLSVPVGMAEMHRRLSVLGKQSRVPMTMLRRLWEVKDELHASVIAREFEQVGLANVNLEKRGSKYVEMLGLHVSVYEFAVVQTKRNGEEQLGHEKLLGGYGAGLLWRGYCREWWSTSLERDSYIHDQLCRHLCGAGRHRELIELLLCPEWAYRAVTVSGVSSLKEDLSLGVRLLNDLNEQRKDIFSDSSSTLQNSQSLEALRFVLEALKLSRSFLTENPGETWFQLHGRLLSKVQRVSSVSTSSTMLGAMAEHISGWWNGTTTGVSRTEAYVNRMEQGGPKPCLRSVNPSLAPVGGVTTQLFALHNKKALCMALMTDGTWAVCGCSDGRIIILNLTRSVVQSEWHAHNKGVLSIAITRDGKRILSGSHDKTAKVWDVQRPRCLTTFQGHKTDVTSVASLRDGNRAVSVDRSGNLHVWDTDTGKIVYKPLNCDKKPWITAPAVMAVFPDGKRVVTGIRTSLQIWNARNGAQVGLDLDFVDFDYDYVDRVSSIDVTMDGKRIVCGSEKGTLRSWCPETHLQIGDSLKANGSYINCVNVSADGKRILSGSEDGTVRVWDAENETEACDPLVEHSSSITGALFLPNSNSFLSCSLDGTVRSWDLRREGDERVLDRDTSQIRRVLFTREGMREVPETVPNRHTSEIRRVSFTPEGTRAVSESKDGTLRIWDARSGRLLSRPLQIRQFHPQHWTQVSNFRNRPYYVSTNCFILDVDSFRRLSAVPRRLLVTCLEVTSKGQVLAGFEDGRVEVGDLKYYLSDCFRGLVGEHDSRVKRVFVSDDGLRAVSVDSSDNICSWDLKQRTQIRHVIKSDASSQCRRWIMEAIGEVAPETPCPLIPLEGFQIIYWDGKERRVLATMESRVMEWAQSPDKSTICLGLENGRVAFLRLTE